MRAEAAERAATRRSGKLSPARPEDTGSESGLSKLKNGVERMMEKLAPEPRIYGIRYFSTCLFLQMQ